MASIRDESPSKEGEIVPSPPTELISREKKLMEEKDKEPDVTAPAKRKRARSTEKENETIDIAALRESILKELRESDKAVIG